MINLTIDGVQIEAKEGQSILSAAREHESIFLHFASWKKLMKLVPVVSVS